MLDRSHRALVLAAALLACAAAAADEPGPAQAPPPPSVLLVTLDTTRADRIGCYGAKDASTPALDRLAAGGVRFDIALAPTPLTLPSHATILTGRVPRRHGVRNNAGYRLAADVPVLAEILRARGYRTAGFVSSLVLDRVTGIDRGFERYDDVVRVGEYEAFGRIERAAGQTNEAVFSALPSLEPPFFLWVHYFDPHLPYVPPEPYRSRFGGRPYDGEIAYTDAQLGALIEAVRERSPSLLVAVAGDHGESLGEHGEDAHGVFVYQATQRVPFVLAGPGVPEGRVVRETVGLVDVMPSVLDLLGVPSPAGLDGRSVAATWSDDPPAPQAYEMETMFPAQAYGWGPLRGLVRDGLKYVAAPRPELYDLARDPGELDDLSQATPGKTAALAAALSALAGDDVASEPPAPDPLLAEQRRRLEALGYVTGGGSGGGNPIDPKDGVKWLADLEAGRRAYRSGDPAAGIEPLTRLVRRNPHNSQAWLALGLCHLSSGDAPGAERAFREAVDLRPDDDLAHFNLANALASRAERNGEAADGARRHYEEAIRLNPRFSDAYRNYASLLERTGDAAAALAALERARGEGIRDPELEILLAVLLLKAARPEPAMEAFGRALELHPRDAQALEAMALLAYRAGSYAESASYYRRLLDVRPDAEAARRLGAILLERLGDVAGARAAFGRALELMPDDDPRRPAIAEAVEKLGG